MRPFPPEPQSMRLIRRCTLVRVLATIPAAETLCMSSAQIWRCDHYTRSPTEIPMTISLFKVIISSAIQLFYLSETYLLSDDAETIRLS